MDSNSQIVKHEQDVLVGSSRITSVNQKEYDREAYMVENMNYNKAYFSSLENDKNASPTELLARFQKYYKEYRRLWTNQPKECYKQSIASDLLDKGYRPLSIDIETAAICDLACPFCYRESLATPDKTMDMELFKSIVNQAADLGVPSIKLNWRGEPLLHPKLYKMIEYAKQKGIIETIINTNATNLTRQTSERLINSGLDFMIYSFDGGTKETYEKMRPGRFKKNNFEDVYQNIVNFSNIRNKMGAKFPRTKIQMILTEDSYHEQESFFSLFKEFVDEVTVTQYTERGGNLKDLNKDERAQYDYLCSQLDLPKDTPYMKDANGDIMVSSSRIACEQPYQRMLITYDGRVAMCCHDWGAMYPIGYVSSNSFLNDEIDKLEVIQNVEKNKKGFELMRDIKLPPRFNKPEKKVETLSQIWIGKEVEKVRSAHRKEKVDKINICKKCTFKDTYNWVKS